MVHRENSPFGNAQVQFLEDDAHDPLLVFCRGRSDDLGEDQLHFRSFCFWTGDRIQVGVEFGDREGALTGTPVLDHVEDHVRIVDGVAAVEALRSGQGLGLDRFGTKVEGTNVELSHCGDLNAVRVAFAVDLGQQQPNEGVEGEGLRGDRK